MVLSIFLKNLTFTVLQYLKKFTLTLCTVKDKLDDPVIRNPPRSGHFTKSGRGPD